MWGKYSPTKISTSPKGSCRPLTTTVLIAHGSSPLVTYLSTPVLCYLISISPMGKMGYFALSEIISKRTICIKTLPTWDSSIIPPQGQSPLLQGFHPYKGTISIRLQLHHNSYNCGLLSKWHPLHYIRYYWDILPYLSFRGSCRDPWTRPLHL